ncbi:MAG TPA: NADH-quinone oxidoreductase subunit NuoB [Bryobacteraceae bacterium]|nr:NADH-quinone oxidoreductase subunit NuoB [Bryobacteraceae bacterium]
MFKILQKTFATGLVTTRYPEAPATISEHFRGRPDFDFEAWRDARPAADACPSGAISVHDGDGTRTVTVDYGRCVFCGQCAEVSGGAVQVTRDFELAATDRAALACTAEYALEADGSHRQLLGVRYPPAEETGARAAEAIRRVLGRSLAIRQVDTGSCNGCELEIGALNNPVFDIERFGIHFVASPRHADALLVTGPVTRNMELALQKTYAATPDPKIVIATGACAISGGMFGVNYATRGAVDQVIPVDVYIAGCPPRPQALLYGILMAVGRLARKSGG